MLAQINIKQSENTKIKVTKRRRPKPVKKNPKINLKLIVPSLFDFLKKILGFLRFSISKNYFLYPKIIKNIRNLIYYGKDT